MDIPKTAFDFIDPLPRKKEQQKEGAENVKPKQDKNPGSKIKSTRGRKSLKSFNIEVDLITIPDDEILFAKSYYSIGDVARMFKLNSSLIRFWENEFDILKPKKNPRGNRHFRPEDVKNLKLIYHLLRERKYTIEGAKDFLKNNRHAVQKFEIISSLKNLRSFLLELKTGL